TEYEVRWYTTLAQFGINHEAEILNIVHVHGERGLYIIDGGRMAGEGSTLSIEMLMDAARAGNLDQFQFGFSDDLRAQMSEQVMNDFSNDLARTTATKFDVKYLPL